MGRRTGRDRESAGCRNPESDGRFHAARGDRLAGASERSAFHMPSAIPAIPGTYDLGCRLPPQLSRRLYVLGSDAHDAAPQFFL